MSTSHFVVTESENNLRLDLLLARRYPHWTRGAIARLLTQHAIRVDGQPAKKGLRIRTGQKISLSEALDGAILIAQAELPLTVLREADAFIAFNKPAGCASHPLNPGERGTLANALVARFPECAQASDDPREGGLVHRLDFGTSGVIIAARSPQAYQQLRQAFGAGAVKKKYWALVAGQFTGEITVDAALTASSDHAGQMQVVSAERYGSGLLAITHVRLLGQIHAFSLVEATTCHGRRHQVRVHLAHLGFPLVGDEPYGGALLAHQSYPFLHARSIEFWGETIAAPLPPERQLFLSELGFPAEFV